MIRRCPFRSWILAGIALLLVATGAAAQTHPAVTPVPRDGDSWMDRHNQINERIEQGNVDLLFVGDSITHGWEGARVGRDGQARPAAGQAVWDEYYVRRNAANIGIGGDRTEHVLWRLDHGNIDGISPRLAVVMIGTNNSRANTAQEIADGIVAIVETLRDELPEAKVLLLAIFPRGEQPSETRVKLAEASGLAAGRVADGEWVHYLNIGSSFLAEDGTLPADVMPDALHPNENGYRIWAEAIEPTIRELMGE
jgi:beta-glucosidase